jgi:uncharacterized membrane protein YfcA
MISASCGVTQLPFFSSWQILRCGCGYASPLPETCVTATDIILVLIGSFCGGFLNAIAGGGGLVTLPVMVSVFPGASLPSIFGTNKAAMVWGTAWAARSYARRVSLPWRRLAPAVLAAVGGSVLGAWLLTVFPSEWLRKLLPVLLALVFAYTLASRQLGREHAPVHAARWETLWAAVIALGLGFYDGFFGPGTGSFFVFLFVRVLGYDFLHASAAAKLLNSATNAAAIVVFALGGAVWWPLVLPMAIVNVVGAGLGTWLALHRGSGFVRRVFLVIVAALILKTGYDAFFRQPAMEQPVAASAAPPQPASELVLQPKHLAEQ